MSSLAEAAYDHAQGDTDEDPVTYPMSGVYEKIIEKLLNTTDRTDGHMNNLRGSAYEAIMEMIKNSPSDCYETVLKTTNVVMDRINRLIQMEVCNFSCCSVYYPRIIRTQVVVVWGLSIMFSIFRWRPGFFFSMWLLN